MKKITVIGATGMIGIPVTNELSKAGFEITALVRDVTKAKEILPDTIEFIKGDLREPFSIMKAIRDAEGLYINLSIKPTDKQGDFIAEIDGLDNILSAAKKSSIKQIVYLSSFLARNYQGSWWVMNAKKEGIHKVKHSDIPYTVFYPSNFMENFQHGVNQGNGVTVVGKSIHKAWWIAGEDFGRQVAAAFNTPQAVNREYAAQGLEPFTMLEAAQCYVKHYDKDKLKTGSLPMGLLKFLSLFSTKIHFITELMDIMIHNKEIFESQETWDELGKPQIPLEQFAKME